jgi:hypothetical protein
VDLSGFLFKVLRFLRKIHIGLSEATMQARLSICHAARYSRVVSGPPSSPGSSAAAAHALSSACRFGRMAAVFTRSPGKLDCAAEKHLVLCSKCLKHHLYSPPGELQRGLLIVISIQWK